jgi:hypothetical protein
MNRPLAAPLCLVLALPALTQQQPPSTPRHFVFFGHERERIRGPAWLATPALVGAQLKYSWRELEPERGTYAFAAIQSDLDFLGQHGKQLWVQLQDVTFDDRLPVPDWLCTPEFGGGAARKYEGDEDPATPDRFDGWVARRWDAKVAEHFHALLAALGEQFDGRIAGLNLAETAIAFGDDPAQWPEGFTPARYAAATRDTLDAARAAFGKSPVVVYANFMPGEWLPWEDHGYLRGVHAHAAKIGVGVGGPDLRPLAKGQQNHILPLLRARPAGVVGALAVQDGNLDEVDPKTKQPLTPQDLLRIAREDLRLDFVFWGTQEPHFSAAILPLLRELPRPQAP